MVTQLTTFILLYSCNNISLNTAGMPAKTCCLGTLWIIYIINIGSAFVGYLYILDNILKAHKQFKVIGLLCQDINIGLLVPGGLCHTLGESSLG